MTEEKEDIIKIEKDFITTFIENDNSLYLDNLVYNFACMFHQPAQIFSVHHELAPNCAQIHALLFLLA